MTVFATPTNAKAWGLDQLGVIPEEFIAESLLVQATTRVGVIDGDSPQVRCPVVDLDDEAGFAPEGADLDEAEPEGSEVVISTGKVAVLVKVSNEQMNQEAAQQVIRSAVERAVSRKVDWALLAQPAPTPPAYTPPAGLLIGATDGGAITTNLDPLIDAVATIESGNGIASHVIASPSAWAEVQKLKDEDTSNRSLIGAGTTAAARTLLGLPVIVTTAAEPGVLAVLARNQVVSAYGPVMTAVSRDAFFGADSVGIRATLRFGATAVKPTAVVKLTVDDLGS